MTHVWQAQREGRLYLPLMRHPFCRYAYEFEPGKPFRRYGLEQQAEIVRHRVSCRPWSRHLGSPAGRTAGFRLRSESVTLLQQMRRRKVARRPQLFLQWLFGHMSAM